MFKHILVPTDGSDLSTAALKWTCHLAKDQGAQLLVLNVQPPFIPPTVADIPVAMVYPPDDYDAVARQTAEGILEVSRQAAVAEGVSIEAVYEQHPSPYEAIIAMAEQRGCDLIVMGSHGRTGFAKLLMGSETSKVISHSKVPVLIYR